MKGSIVGLFFGVLLLTGVAPKVASAQGSIAAAQVHIDRAKAAAYRPGFDLTTLYERICAPALSEKGPQEAGVVEQQLPSPEPIPPRSEWYSEPAKVFDNLYWLGSSETTVACLP